MKSSIRKSRALEIIVTRISNHSPSSFPQPPATPSPFSEHRRRHRLPTIRPCFTHAQQCPRIIDRAKAKTTPVGELRPTLQTSEHSAVAAKVAPAVDCLIMGKVWLGLLVPDPPECPRSRSSSACPSLAQSYLACKCGTMLETSPLRLSTETAECPAPTIPR